MIKTLSIALFLLTIQYYSSLAQNNKVTPVSPAAAALAKSINFPVGYDTGVPGISIPLHEIKAGSLSLPISINYHAGGFKVGELPTSIGMGWSINCDLQVSRSINGLDDFTTGPYPRYYGYYYNGVGPYFDAAGPMSSYNTFIDLQDAIDVKNNKIDQQPDQFSFKLNGKSGTFYFQKHQGGGVTAVTVPYSNVKIDWKGNNKFEIIDTDGTLYKFGDTDLEITQIETQSSVTAWKCYEVISPNKADTLSLQYTEDPQRRTYSYPEKIEVFENSECYGANLVFPSLIDPTVLTYGNLKNTYPLFYRLSSPRFMVYTADDQPYDTLSTLRSGFYMVHEKAIYNNGYFVDYETVYKKFTNPTPYTVVDVYSRSLQKISHRSGSVLFSGTYPVLEEISIRDDHNQEIKEILLNHSITCYTPGGTNTGTAYLDSLSIGKGTLKETYKFNYNQKPCFHSNLKGSDSWGGYSGSTRDVSMNVAVPFQEIFIDYYYKSTACNSTHLIFTIGSGDKNPNLYYASLGILNKITYPGGGYTTFSYELNSFKDSDGLTKPAGGLRIKSIKDYDGINTVSSATEKNYMYGDGIIKHKPVFQTNYLGTVYPETIPIHNS